MASRRVLAGVLAAFLGVAGAGGSEIHRAAGKGDLAQVKQLLAANPKLLEAVDKNRKTALHHAAAESRIAVVKLLVAKGANVNARKASGGHLHRDWTPLHFAARANLQTFDAEKKKTIAAMLIAKGADLRARDNSGQTPLMVACSYGNLGVAQVLLAKGADINAKTANRAGQRMTWNRTPLHFAADDNLLTLNAENKKALTGDANLRAFDGENKKAITAMLIAKGADIKARDSEGQTPLVVACSHGNLGVAQVLLAKGADVNTKTNKGFTPLLLAAERGYTEIAEILLSLGADINARNRSGQTPLHRALVSGKQRTAEFLVAQGADPQAGDVNQNTVLHLAAEKGYLQAAGTLLQRGAKINALNDVGETPLDLTQTITDDPKLAAQRQAVAQLLREQGGKSGEEFEEE